MKIWTSEHIFKWVTRSDSEIGSRREKNFPFEIQKLPNQCERDMESSDKTQICVLCDDAHATEAFWILGRSKVFIMQSSAAHGLNSSEFLHQPCAVLALLSPFSPLANINRARTKEWIIDCLTTYHQEPHRNIPRDNLASVCSCDVIGNIHSVSASWLLR